MTDCVPRGEIADLAAASRDVFYIAERQWPLPSAPRAVRAKHGGRIVGHVVDDGAASQARVSEMIAEARDAFRARPA